LESFFSKTLKKKKKENTTKQKKEDTASKAEKEGQEQQGDFDDTGFQQQARPFAMKFPMKIGVLLDCDRQQVTFYVNGEELATLSTVVEQPGTQPGTQSETPPGTPPIAYLPVFGIAGMNQDYSITLLPPPPLTSLPRGPIHQTTKYKEGGNTQFSVGLDRGVREIGHTCWWYSLCNFQYRPHYENTGLYNLDCWIYTNMYFYIFIVCVNTMTSMIHY
jgi:hypothetical protein